MSHQSLTDLLAEAQSAAEDHIVWRAADIVAAQVMVGETLTRRAIEILLLAARIVNATASKDQVSMATLAERLANLDVLSEVHFTNWTHQLVSNEPLTLPNGEVLQGISVSRAAAQTRANGLTVHSPTLADIVDWAMNEVGPRQERVAAIMRAQTQEQGDSPTH